jgi:lipid II:glycine glycyltransferase (peptidoglycan interpeptide bridge formation enzyme)
MIQNLTIRHALQSVEWMKFQADQGKKIISGSGDGWSVNAVLEGSSSKIRGAASRIYAPYGPQVNSLKALKEALNFLDATAKVEGASYVRIEPVQCFTPVELESMGCKKAHRNSQPNMTNVVDLTKDTEELLLAMDASVRRLSRQSDQLGLSFKISYNPADMDEFLNMMRVTAERSNAVFKESDYLRSTVRVLGPTNTAAVAYAYHEGKPVSGVLFYDDFEGKTRYYLHAGSYDEARKARSNPALALHLLLSAKQAGLERFDFYGVSPAEDTNHKWAGFSSFKRSFGGIDVTYSGTWELPVNKLHYNAMRLVRSIKKH